MFFLGREVGNYYLEVRSHSIPIFFHFPHHVPLQHLSFNLSVVFPALQSHAVLLPLLLPSDSASK